MNKLFFAFLGGLKFTAPNYLALTWNRHRCLLPAPFLNDRQVRCAWSTFVKFLSCPSLPTQPVTTGHVHVGTMGDSHWWCYTPEHLLGPAAFARPVQYLFWGASGKCAFHFHPAFVWQAPMSALLLQSRAPKCMEGKESSPLLEATSSEPLRDFGELRGLM